MRKTLLALIFFSLVECAWSQKTDCTQSLTQAQDEFNAGHFFGLSSILQECLESNGFSNEQKVQAYRLLAQAYLLTEDPIAAEDSYLRLLKADPEYLADEIKDPVDVYYLSKKFTATPRFTPTLFRLGGNLSFARTIQKINTNSDPNTTYRQVVKAGFQIGTGMDYNINDNIAVSGELDFSFRSFKKIENKVFKDDEKILTEKQYWIDVPLYVKYADHLGKIRPFAYAGFAFNFLLSTQGQLETINTEGASQSSTQGANEKLSYKRNFFNRSLIVGGGMRYKVGKDFIVFDVRYMAGLTNITSSKDNFYNSKDGNDMAATIARYQFISDYFRLDNISLSIGYVKPLYDPRKIKKAKTKSAMKKISKQDK